MPRFLLSCLLLALCGCGSQPQEGADSSVPVPTNASAPASSTTTTTAPLAPTTTVYSPDTVEGQIEAAYLRSWEVFGEAIVQADPALLHESYAGEALNILVRQAEQLIEKGESVRLSRTFNYTVARIGAGRGAVADSFVNHSVTIDRSTGEPTEADPNEQVLGNYTFAKEGQTWKIIDIVIDAQPLQP